MPRFYKKRAPKRRYKKRVYRKKRAATFRPKTGYLKVIHHEIKMKTLPAGAMPNGLVDDDYFDIQLLPNIAEYQRLFDMYRIKAVKVKLTPLTNTDDQVNQGLIFASAIDMDGGQLPGVFEDILARTNAKVSNWTPGLSSNPTKTITIYPRARNVIANIQDPTNPGVLVPAYAMKAKKQWIDLASIDVPHHGLVMGWKSPGGTLNSPQTYAYDVTYVVEFRGIR